MANWPTVPGPIAGAGLPGLFLAAAAGGGGGDNPLDGCIRQELAAGVIRPRTH